eukprot:SAG31_NODE_2867_length_4979_cov_2.330123_8_plen_71_part_00
MRLVCGALLAIGMAGVLLTIVHYAIVIALYAALGCAAYRSRDSIRDYCGGCDRPLSRTLQIWDTNSPYDF